ncbi:hypothetical protein BC938DRAFT_471965 [Jimgerdemannia flammicorona]|uniref:Uncharacterized protein n=1 Tax=Jimgerdemannia flammicorona TaxID=994334 RepID=A0A433Q6Y8_9FUNG|nr:hypothetical protein BC938DRAFT_471965 [Jimgerdemannia flammicorona]
MVTKQATPTHAGKSCVGRRIDVKVSVLLDPQPPYAHHLVPTLKNVPLSMSTLVSAFRSKNRSIVTSIVLAFS